MPLAEGTTSLLAKAGQLTDTSKIVKVAEPDQSCIMQEKGAVLNGWDITETAGKCSLNTKFSEFGKIENGVALVEAALAPHPDVSKIPLAYCVDGIGNFSVLKILGLFSMMVGNMTKEQRLTINEALNRIDLA